MGKASQEFRSGDQASPPERVCDLEVWRPIDTAPREPRSRGHSFGPLIYVLMPYHPKPDWDVGWWCTYHHCFRFTHDDGPGDMQPTAWAPLHGPEGQR